MRFLFDEGLPFRLARYLEQDGHDVAVCGRDLPYALDDRDILAIAHRERRILRTNDKDYGDLVFRDHLPHSGVILLRLGFVSIDVRIAYMQQILTEFADRLDQFIVVSPVRIRVSSVPEVGRQND